MNPVDVFLSSLIKFGLSALAGALVATGIVFIIKKIVKNNKIKKGITSTQVSKKNKLNQVKSNELQRAADKTSSADKTVGEIDKKINLNETSKPVNAESFEQTPSKVMTSISDPRLLDTIKAYVANAHITKETEFAKLKIDFPENVRRKSEVLVAPSKFIESVFITKVCYECAIDNNATYPITLTYSVYNKNYPYDKIVEIPNRITATKYSSNGIKLLSEKVILDAKIDASILPIVGTNNESNNQSQK